LTDQDPTSDPIGDGKDSGGIVSAPPDPGSSLHRIERANLLAFLGITVLIVIVLGFGTVAYVQYRETQRRVQSDRTNQQVSACFRDELKVRARLVDQDAALTQADQSLDTQAQAARNRLDAAFLAALQAKPTSQTGRDRVLAILVQAYRDEGVTQARITAAKDEIARVRAENNKQSAKHPLVFSC
jgi:hypothetical protein